MLRTNVAEVKNFSSSRIFITHWCCFYTRNSSSFTYSHEKKMFFKAEKTSPTRYYFALGNQNLYEVAITILNNFPKYLLDLKS